MRFLKNSILFSPTDLVRFFESEFASYMDHFEKVISEETKKELKVYRDKPDPLYSLIIEMGHQHEAEMLAEMKKKAPLVCIETQNQKKDIAIEQTFSAMQKGVKYIYQAALRKNNFFGYADLLVKNKGTCILGDYHYIPYDFKLARHPKPSAIIQLCAYCEILENLQGKRPPAFIVVTKDGSEHCFQTKKFFYFYKFLKQKFMSYHLSFTKSDIPIPDKEAEHRDWSHFAKKRLKALDDVSLTAGIRSHHSLILRKTNIQSFSDLANLNFSKRSCFKGISETVLWALKEQAELQLASKEKEKPKFKLIPLFHKHKKGLSLLPPVHPQDIFFDIESYPFLGKEGLEYLYGNVLNNKDQEYRYFWASKETEEAGVFKNWLKWVYQRWKTHNQMHIYHYGAYELSALKKLMGKYGQGDQEIDELLLNHVFVDLRKILIQSVRMGVSSYSLKDVEQICYERNGEIRSEREAILSFYHFLNSPENPDQSPFVKRIKQYNKEDCLSLKKICEWLRKQQSKQGISYICPIKDKKHTEEKQSLHSEIKIRCQQKAEELISTIPFSKRNLPLSEMKSEQTMYIACMFSHLLHFHIREDKPTWWNYFSRLEMTETEMLEDSHTIANCYFISTRDNKHKIKFEKDQDIGFRIGDKLIILDESLDNIKNTHTICDLQLLNGLLFLQSNHVDCFPKNTSFTLVPEKNDFYKKNLFASLLKSACQYSAQKPLFGLNKCIHDLLLKKDPDLLEYKDRTGVSNPHNRLKEIQNRIAHLNHSVFCIQGPPGSGKTYTIAHIILYLIKNKKKVGVTANSHKAILNVLKTLHEQNQSRDNFIFECQKVKDSKNSKEEFKELENIPIDLVSANKVKNSSAVVGGTCFFFSRSSEEGVYDYLFVDEASQVSLANIVAASRSSYNIVLVGDQNQLEQPTKAHHPGESALSALSYYTNQSSTISPRRGVFLPVSYRMHSSICRFVSEHFYEGKLSSHSCTLKQKIIFPKKEGNSKNLPESGLYFIPIEHIGNTHSSIEEAKLIASLYKELLKAKWLDQKAQTQNMTNKDILVVAPYNLQVAVLQEKLPDSARIGTVDKFQGQEAAVAILSLASSSVLSAPIGISFLLNKNRLNVALSRARVLSIVVGSKNLADTYVSSIPNMELMNIWSHLVSYSK